MFALQLYYISVYRKINPFYGRLNAIFILCKPLESKYSNAFLRPKKPLFLSNISLYFLYLRLKLLPFQYFNYKDQITLIFIDFFTHILFFLRSLSNRVLYCIYFIVNFKFINLSNTFNNLYKIINVIYYIVLIRRNMGFPSRNINA